MKSSTYASYTAERDGYFSRNEAEDPRLRLQMGDAEDKMYWQPFDAGYRGYDVSRGGLRKYTAAGVVEGRGAEEVLEGPRGRTTTFLGEESSSDESDVVLAEQGYGVTFHHTQSTIHSF